MKVDHVKKHLQTLGINKMCKVLEKKFNQVRGRVRVWQQYTHRLSTFLDVAAAAAALVVSSSSSSSSSSSLLSLPSYLSSLILSVPCISAFAGFASWPLL